MGKINSAQMLLEFSHDFRLGVLPLPLPRRLGFGIWVLRGSRSMLIPDVFFLYCPGVPLVGLTLYYCFYSIVMAYTPPDLGKATR